MKLLGLLLLLASVWTGGLRAGELVPGLAYLRPGAEIVAETGSAVVDLRYTADDAAAPLLAALAPGKTNPHRVILVLISPETSAGLLRQLTILPRCLTIGHAAPDFTADIIVSTSAEADRRAFDALAAGTPPETLMVENADKPRYDETSLIQEHRTGLAPAEPSATEAEAAEPALVDTVLQTAVHIYRGLTVLKKL